MKDAQKRKILSHFPAKEKSIAAACIKLIEEMFELKEKSDGGEKETKDND